MEEFHLEFADQFHLAVSMTDGQADERYFLWVPDWSEDAQDKDYLVLLNTGGRLEKKFQILYHFKAEFVSKKCCFAISKDGRTALAGYAAKKGVICYNCESGKVLWNNPKIKKIARIRFNNFDEDIIEVSNDKLEFTYLDRRSGQVLEPERVQKIRQTINWMCASGNGKFLMTADPLAGSGRANYTVYDTQTKKVKGRFVAQCHLNPHTFDVTDDGELAVCSAYYRQGVSLIKTSTGEVLWTKLSYKKISGVSIDKTEEKVIVCCDGDGIYFLDMGSGETVDHILGEEYFSNVYGGDILFLNSKTARIGDRYIPSPGFAWKSAVGAKDGVILTLPGIKGLLFYDHDGNLLWESSELGGRAAYLEEDDLICAFGVESYEGKVADGTLVTGQILLASPKDGQIIARAEISDSAQEFIRHNSTVVCSTGKMYDVSHGSIQEREEIFEFVTGMKR